MDIFDKFKLEIIVISWIFLFIAILLIGALLNTIYPTKSIAVPAVLAIFFGISGAILLYNVIKR